MPDSSNRCELAALMGPEPTAAAQDCEVSALNRRFAELVAQYDRAEDDYRAVAKRCNASHFEALFADDRLSEAERGALILERERATGVDKASDRSDLAYAEVLAFADELIKLSSTAPAILGLKARACLWEKTAEDMRHDGCVRAAEFLTQLAALS